MCAEHSKTVRGAVRLCVSGQTNLFIWCNGIWVWIEFGIPTNKLKEKQWHKHLAHIMVLKHKMPWKICITFNTYCFILNKQISLQVLYQDEDSMGYGTQRDSVGYVKSDIYIYQTNNYSSLPILTEGFLIEMDKQRKPLIEKEINSLSELVRYTDLFNTLLCYVFIAICNHVYMAQALLFNSQYIGYANAQAWSGRSLFTKEQILTTKCVNKIEKCTGKQDFDLKSFKKQLETHCNDKEKQHSQNITTDFSMCIYHIHNIVLDCFNEKIKKKNREKRINRIMH